MCAIYPDCVGIFILPPSLEEPERRLDNARGEMDHAGEFDYAIINKDFDMARRKLAEVIRAERANPDL